MAKNLEITVLYDFYGDLLTEKQQEVIDRVLKMDLKSVADQLMAQAMAQSQEEFQEAERKGKALEAARRG